MTDFIPKFQIGDHAWYATVSSENNYVTCPDCGGTGQITVIMYDGTQVSVDCQNCSVGYDAPTGRVKVYDRAADAMPVTVAGFSVGGFGGVEYRTSESYLIKEDRIFTDRESALECGAKMAVEADKKERWRIATKEKDTRSWAWNATYHRQCIRRAEKEIAYHTAKLNVAKIKAKEPA